MTLASQIVSDSYREINVVPLGIAPTTNQLTEGLEQFNRYLGIIFGSQIGELLQDWEAPSQQRTAPVAANYPQLPHPLGGDVTAMSMPLSGGTSTLIWPYPPKNSRIVFGSTQDARVYFPEQPDDGSRMAVIQGALAASGVTLTLDGNSRTIEGQLTRGVVMPLAAGLRWIYRADIGDWRPVTKLALTDEVPFASDMDDFLSLGLAIRLAPKNDKTVSAETAAAFKNATSIFQARYKQSGTTTYKSADIPLGYESFLPGRNWI